MSDIVERLNVYGRSEFGQSVPGFMFVEAATEIAKLQTKLAEARDKALDEAASLMQSKHDDWRALEAKYRSSGNNGPYLGGPSYYEAARAIRALKSPKPPIL